LYKFVETGALIEGFYNMITTFRKYHIIPVFIFDGKPPAEKKELLDKRRTEKQDAEQKYRILEEQLHLDVPETKEKELEIKHELDMLKKRFVRIHHTDIQLAKELMTAYGVHYIESQGESDQLCAYLVKKSYAWACVSDDMDMFVYGCPRVLRHISLLNHTGVLYDMASILYELNMPYTTFRDLMVLSGTDYNLGNHNNLFDTLKYYHQYQRARSQTQGVAESIGRSKSAIFGRDEVLDEVLYENEDTFYGWLETHTSYIRDKVHLERTREMFDLTRFSLLHQNEIRAIIRMIPFQNGAIQHDKLRALLKSDGFIFL
jgi:5'-3' exonuclease